ncbi:MAG: hypothetical protein IPN70_05225 [Candidatus Moraniibacteriota bacterium]|nr:MAG: hypothetical protein IPN70_05225 [Candidatus Moranbacteria bacterium]
MQTDIVYNIYFGLGIIFQSYFFIHPEFKKEDIKELIKDIGSGLLFATIALFFVAIDGAMGELTLSEILFVFIYTFFFVFCTAFAMSFRRRLLPKVNQVSLLILNIIFLYYITTRLGYVHFFAIFFYIPTIISILFLFFKKDLSNSQKGFLCIWYLVLSIFTAFINIYYISVAPKDYAYSSYATTFLAGSIGLYIYVLIIYLIMFIPLSDKSEHAIARRRAEVKEHFLLLGASFQKLNINTLLFIVTSILLVALLLLNFEYKYFSENLFVVSVIFLIVYINEKLSKAVILNANDPMAQNTIHKIRKIT